MRLPRLSHREIATLATTVVFVILVVVLSLRGRAAPPAAAAANVLDADIPEYCREVLDQLPEWPEDVVKFCEDIQPPGPTDTPPPPPPKRCGPPELVRLVEQIIHRCRGHAACSFSGASVKEFTADVEELYRLSQQYPFLMTFFPTGDDQLPEAERKRIVAFNKKLEQFDPGVLVMCFAAASPPGGATINAQIAYRRTESCYKQELDYIRDSGSRIQPARASIGRDSLSASYCTFLPEGDERARCESLDENRRRQVAILIGYPSECVNEAALTPAPESAPAATPRPRRKRPAATPFDLPARADAGRPNPFQRGPQP